MKIEEKVRKLVLNLHDKKEYLTHIRNLKQEILHILTIAASEIIPAFALAIATLLFKKGRNLVVILGFPHFFSGRKTSGLYLCFIIRKCK